MAFSRLHAHSVHHPLMIGRRLKPRVSFVGFTHQILGARMPSGTTSCTRYTPADKECLRGGTLLVFKAARHPVARETGGAEIMNRPYSGPVESRVVDPAENDVTESEVNPVPVYREGAESDQVLTVGDARRQGACDAREVEMRSWPRDKRIPVRTSRAPVLWGETQRKVTGCGSLYVTLNENESGPREVFANMWNAGGCASASTEAIGRLISLAFKYGAPPDKIVKQLKGIRCHIPLGFGPDQILSCPDAIGRALAEKYLPPSGTAQRATGQLEMPIAVAPGACPECGGSLEYEGGCVVCRSCEYSKM